MDTNFISAETVNNRISGAFNISRSLSLRSHDGRVEASINLENTDEGNPSTLHILTSHAPVKASMNLISTHTTGGAFDVDIHTSDGSLDLRIPSAPLEHKLNLRAETSSSPIRVNVHKFYEGLTKAQTTWAQPKLIWDAVAHHPDGKERTRGMFMRESHSWGSQMVNGTVWWSPNDEGKNRGSVELKTTYSDIDLALSEQVLF